MIAVVWAVALIISVAIIMFGIYMCVRVYDDNTLKLRQAQADLASAIKDNEILRADNRQLKIDLQVEKNRVHNADATE